MIKKILVCNRGEIALRIFHTAKRLGLGTIAIFVKEDRDALHTQEADEKYEIDSYLNQEAIIQIAKQSQASFIHPGYGFLSENENFTQDVEKAGIKYLGPSSKLQTLLGNKDKAKVLANKIKVPTIPGFEIPDSFLDSENSPSSKSTLKELKELFHKNSAQFPILLKATTTGGGRGIRLVNSMEEVFEAIKTITNEAKGAFGKTRIIVEKYIQQAKHIEVQVIGDSFGNVKALGARDCSLQRRNQKIIEESAQDSIDQKTLQKILEVAVKLAKEGGLTSLATVEFLVESLGDTSEKSSPTPFYFLEVNPRIQVEHPVTEMVFSRSKVSNALSSIKLNPASLNPKNLEQRIVVTSPNLDLVELQIKIAEGARLEEIINPKFLENNFDYSGHAIETRICAEEPLNNFLPSLGRISFFDFPLPYASFHSEDDVRFDSAIYQGQEISDKFDSLIGKLIVWGETRELAIEKLIQSLEKLTIVGVNTNIEFLLWSLRSHEFSSNSIYTSYLDSKLGVITSEIKNEQPNLTKVLAGFLYFKFARHFFENYFASQNSDISKLSKTVIRNNSTQSALAFFDSRRTSLEEKTQFAFQDHWKVTCLGRGTSSLDSGSISTLEENSENLKDSPTASSKASFLSMCFTQLTSQNNPPSGSYSSNLSSSIPTLEFEIDRCSYQVRLTQSYGLQNTLQDSQITLEVLCISNKTSSTSPKSSKKTTQLKTNLVINKRLLQQFFQGKTSQLNFNGRNYQFENIINFSSLGGEDLSNKKFAEISSTLPGKITEILVKVGEAVTKGQTLLKLESMKIEHIIESPIAGKVSDINCEPGQTVKAREVVLNIKA